MSSVLINLAENVKEKWVYIEIERFVIQKQFGKQAQVLAVNLVFSSIDLPHTKSALSVYFFANWLSSYALALEDPHIFQNSKYTLINNYKNFTITIW